MAERKLNFNAPLMSVRRSSGATKSSNVAKQKKTENSQLVKRNSFPSCKPDYILEQVTEPVAVPFHWEQIPGRPKDGTMPADHQGLVFQEASITPIFPPRRALDVVKYIEDKKPEAQKVFRPQIEANSFNDIVNRLDSGAKEGVNEKPGFNLENDDDDDDMYSDALDTLSGMDSFSVNCSVSGVSGFDSQVVKPSGTFNTDPHSRDFMMSRFLPAAKAMTLETPHYASRKQPVSGEQSRQIVKVVQRDRTPPVTRNVSLNVPSPPQDLQDEESEDESNEHVDTGKIMTKGCGLLPRLCVKNSLCLLNPVPGMKVRTQSPMSSVRDIKKMAKAVYSRSQSPTIKKPSKDAAVRKQKLENEVQSPRLVGVDNRLTGGSNRFAYASDRQMISRTSPFRRSGGISPYRSEAPQSPFRGGGFLGVPKDLESIKGSRFNLHGKGYSKSQELVPYHAIRRDSRPMSPTIEKTLYVDTVNVAGLLCANSDSSNINEGGARSAEKDIMPFLNSRVQETNPITSSLKDAKSPNFAEHKTGDSESFPVSDSSPHRNLSDTTEDLSQESKALVCISTSTVGNYQSKSGPLPPLLPKTPSESWLWRTLPTVSSQNSSSHLYRGIHFQNKRQDLMTTSASTKWENIVKSSYLHNDHVRYSEELYPLASKQSKS